MAQERGLHWESTKDLTILADQAKKSINTSMEHFNADCPTTNLKLRPTYITDDILVSAKELLRSPQYRDPMLIIDIEANNIEISFVTMTGKNMYQMHTVEKWTLKEIWTEVDSRERFLTLIAAECYKMCNNYTNCFQKLDNAIVLCTIILRFDMDHLSLHESTVGKFDKNFFIPNCEGQNLVELFNRQLKAQQDTNAYRIKCTNMINYSVSVMVGLYMQDSRQPDILVYSSHGSNIAFFDRRDNDSDPERMKMMINSQIFKFGSSAGSNECNLLMRFLEHMDFKINDFHLNNYSLYPMFIEGFQMCDFVLRFLKKRLPYFSLDWKWLESPGALTVMDISQLLECVDKGVEIEGNLSSAYYNFDEKTQKELHELCQNIRDRSASMLAGIVFGFMKACSQKSYTIGLSGIVMLDMYGYREKFEEVLDNLQSWHAKKNGPESAIQARCISAHKTASTYGIAGLSKYIHKMCDLDQ